MFEYESNYLYERGWDYRQDALHGESKFALLTFYMCSTTMCLKTKKIKHIKIQIFFRFYADGEEEGNRDRRFFADALYPAGESNFMHHVHGAIPCIVD